MAIDLILKIIQEMISNKLTIIAITLLTLSVFSCSKDDINLNNLNETFFLRHKNADMPVYVHGNASEKVFLIILHGGPGGNGLGYRANTIRTEIEKNNAVVYFDQRGSGNSQGNYSEEDVSIDIMAEDVLALVKVIRNKYGEGSKLFLMGHSWGGTLGPAVLLKNQTEFLGWIDVDGYHDPAGTYEEYKVVLTESANEQIALGNSVEYWENVLDAVQNIGPNYSTDNHLQLNSMTHIAERVLTEDKIINEGVLDLGDNAVESNGLIDTWNVNKIGYILDYKKGFNEISFTDRLSEITIPSLVLWGKYDHAVPTVNAQEAFDNLGSIDKDIFIFEKSGHSPMNTEPDLFADKVIDFINEHK